jgi:hypothetical protein
VRMVGNPSLIGKVRFARDWTIAVASDR